MHEDSLIATVDETLGLIPDDNKLYYERTFLRFSKIY
jgi:hypothetical protein